MIYIYQSAKKYTKQLTFILFNMQLNILQAYNNQTPLNSFMNLNTLILYFLYIQEILLYKRNGHLYATIN
jgi:hypothetical protein